MFCQHDYLNKRIRMKEINQFNDHTIEFLVPSTQFQLSPTVDIINPHKLVQAGSDFPNY